MLALSESELQESYAGLLPGSGPESVTLINAPLHPVAKTELRSLEISAGGGNVHRPTLVADNTSKVPLRVKGSSLDA